MCARVSLILQDVNEEFRRLIIRWPSFELEQKSSYLSSLLNAFVIVFRTIIIIVIVFDISTVIIILLCSYYTRKSISRTGRAILIIMVITITITLKEPNVNVDHPHDHSYQHKKNPMSMSGAAHEKWQLVHKEGARTAG